MTIKKSRILSSLLALTMAASLVGCGAQHADDPESSPASSGDQPKAGVVSPIQAPETSLHALDAGTDQGRYRVITVPTDYSSLLCYLDFATGNEVPLCASPNCEHRDKSCPAWLHEHNYTILNALDDKHLILLNSDLHTDQTTLSIANADGSDSRILAEYPATYAISPVFSESLLADDEYLYYFADIASKIDDKTVTEPMDYQLFRVPLKGGEPEKMHNIKRDSSELQGIWGRDLILNRYEISSDFNPNEGTTVFIRHSLDTGEETVLGSTSTTESPVATYFSQGNLYWLNADQTDTLFWVDVNGNQNQMPLNWGEGAPAFAQEFYYNFEFTAFIQNHLILNIDGDHRYAYSIDLEKGQASPLTLTYLDALSGQEKPIRILQVVGSDLVVEFASVNEQATHYNPDGSAFLVSTPLTRTGFISIDDYLAGNNNYREFTMIPSVC